MGCATPGLVSFIGLIPNFRRASLPLSYGSPPPPSPRAVYPSDDHVAWPLRL